MPNTNLFGSFFCNIFLFTIKRGQFYLGPPTVMLVFKKRKFLTQMHFLMEMCGYNLTCFILLLFSGTYASYLSYHDLQRQVLGDEIIDNSIQNEPEISWMLLPDDNGEVQVAILSGLEPRNVPEADEIYFLLWTRENPYVAERQVLNESCSPVFHHFNPIKPSKVLIHGFGDNAEKSIMFPLLKDAFLQTGDYNVFAVDWSKMAAAPWYQMAARNTMMAAKHTAFMIDYLVEQTGTDINNFHLIGFSLGAHVVGMTGQFVKSGRIKRITGLDPAQVLFTSAPEDYRLDDSDARLVEVIHTSGGYLAFMEPIGHRDFFPNGGSWPQPGCVLDFVAVCSHRRAYYYFAEAITRPLSFLATPCSDYYAFQNGQCENGTFKIPMWNDYDDSVRGKFFLDTNSKEPFSID